MLVFDPGCASADMRKLLTPNTSSTHFNRLRKFPTHLKHRQYQVVVVEGVLSEEEKQVKKKKNHLFENSLFHPP